MLFIKVYIRKFKRDIWDICEGFFKDRYVEIEF